MPQASKSAFTLLSCKEVLKLKMITHINSITKPPIPLHLSFTNTDLLIYWMSVEWFCLAVMAVLHIKCYLMIK